MCSRWPATTAWPWEPRSIAPRLPRKFRTAGFPLRSLDPQYIQSEIEAALHRFDGRIQWQRFDSLEATCASAARLIADGRVIAWYRGRMEYGPRALGNRSILADPGRPEMRDRINAMVKKREAFRPFAPACSVEEAHRWFEVAPGDGTALHDQRGRCASGGPGPASRHHPRQRFRPPADRVAQKTIRIFTRFSWPWAKPLAARWC